MLQNTKQTSRKYRIAAFNQLLDRNSICPANHDVNYEFGWYYYDGEPEQRPGVTRQAKEMEKDPNVMVFYNDKFNTYVTSSVVPRGEA